MNDRNKKVLEWLEKHPEVSPKKLCEQAGIPWYTLYNLKRGRGGIGQARDIPEVHWLSLLDRLKKLGYK